MTQRSTIVTGAASGIGAAIATELQDRGHLVVVTDMDHTRGEEQASRIGAPFRRLDVTDPGQIEAVVASVRDEIGPLGAWVSNAGVSRMARFVDIPLDQFDRTIAVNLRAVFSCGQAAARAMIAGGEGGRIVNIASMAGKQGKAPFLADYVASKFGVVGLTQAMALELAEHDITVNSVCPGFVATDMQEREIAWEAELRGVDEAAVRDGWIADTPLGRLEEPADVARVVAFLLSDDAAFVTGEALAVNGGAYMD